MASGNAVKKKEGVKKKNTAARSKTRGRAKASAKKSLNNEVQGIVLIALGLLLLVSLIMGQSAVVPKAISGFLFGAFGLFAYVVPVMLIVWGVFRILLKKVTLHGGKIASSIAFDFKRYRDPALHYDGCFSKSARLLGGHCRYLCSAGRHGCDGNTVCLSVVCAV